MNIDITPEPNAEDRKYEREQAEKLEREKQKTWEPLLTWPPIQMLSESLRAEVSNV